MPSLEQTADTGMFWNAGEEEEVVKTVLPMKAATEEVVVEPEDETELEDDANVPLWGAISNAGKDKEVVETVLPLKGTEEEGVVEPEDETKVEDITYVNESRSVIKR